MVFKSATDKASFVEGPCNCVNRLLKETNPSQEESKDAFEIADLVSQSDFSLDTFDESSCLHLLCDKPGRSIVLPRREIFTSARVGLTLKRYDAEKEKYWMADYRFLTFPALHSKMKDLIIVSCLAKEKSIAATCELAQAKMNKAVELANHVKKGQKAATDGKQTMRSCH